jgi:DNA invertase Pin-like site-specific DNA recombinase
MSPKQPRRAVGYVRVSVDRAEETSTETQEESIRAYCTAHGSQVVDVIVEAGRSAYKASRTSRPGFKKVMRLVQSGAADMVIVWKIDRACRNTEDTLALVRELAGHGAQFASVTEHFDTSTPSGKMMLTVLAALAEMESATKSERIMAWQEKRLADGATPTGPRPYGYRRERNRLLVNLDEAGVIRHAANEVLAGTSLNQIAKDLAAVKVKGKSGKPLSFRAVKSILIGPTVAGCREMRPGVFEPSDQWEAILDLDSWRAVRAILTDPARRTNTTNKPRWLLSGIATCSQCKDEDGHPVSLKISSHQVGPRYRCPECSLSIEAPRTDKLIEDALLGLLDRKRWRRLRQGQDIGADISGFEEAMGKLTSRFVAGDLTGEEMGRLADALRQETTATPHPSLPDVEDLTKAWPLLPIEQRRLVMAAATESLRILPWLHRNGFDDERVQWVPVP